MSGAPQSGKAPALAALAFAVAGALACWNPFAAPFGLILGAASAILAARALQRRQGRRSLAMIALALGIAGGLVSAVLLLTSTGLLHFRLAGEHVVTQRTPAELKALLDASAERSAEARKRASRELDELGEPGGRDGGPQADAGNPRPRKKEHPAGRAQD